MKHLEIFAGPNGSGKSTFAETLFLQDKNKSPRFINSDVIATGISPLDVDAAAFSAGRIMLEAINESIAQGLNFAFETTLSGKTWTGVIREAKAQGYQITIYYLFLDRVQDNLKRIKHRTKIGGHNVPHETVKRRYPKSIVNFWNLYRPSSDNWFIFNNSGKKPKQVHSKESFGCLSTEKQAKFEHLFLSKAKERN